jgi:hypothetical protein
LGSLVVAQAARPGARAGRGCARGQRQRHPADASHERHVAAAACVGRPAGAVVLLAASVCLSVCHYLPVSQPRDRAAHGVCPSVCLSVCLSLLASLTAMRRVPRRALWAHVAVGGWLCHALLVLMLSGSHQELLCCRPVLHARMALATVCLLEPLPTGRSFAQSLTANASLPCILELMKGLGVGFCH